MRSFIQLIICLFRAWTWRMAWRDSRRSRRKLLLYASSIVLGVAALTAISSFGKQMEQAIGEQSKSLLGADLVVMSREPFGDDQNRFLAELGGEQAREVAFGSMVYFPRSEGTRLVQVRALEGRFPFYGEMETMPSNAVAEFRAGHGALVEQALMDLYQAHVGDPVKVGDVTMPIVGTLVAVPGETVAMGSIAPRIFVPMERVARSAMLGQGSLVNYKAYLRLSSGMDAESLVEERREDFRRLELRVDTVAERQRDLGRGMDHLLRFLNLVGLVALLLGGVGVASGIHVHIKQKLPAVATLRCLGAGVPQAMAIYLAQAMALGLLGAVVGAMLGIGAQFLLQASIADFLPVELSSRVSFAAVWHGIWIGSVICLVFSLMPLLPIRRVPPLAALRSSVSHEVSAGRDPWVWLLYGIAGVGLVMFSIAQNHSIKIGTGYAAGIGGAFLLLAISAWLISRVTRLLLPASWPFVWRYGFGNLFRPNNQTVLLTQSLGIGVFLVLTMYLVQLALLSEVAPLQNGRQGNAVLFDIQSDQKQGVLEILNKQGLPVIEDAPMISMRLHSVNGEPVEEIRDRKGPGGWALTREYRSTYRSALTASETLVVGKLHQRVETLDEPVPVSLEQDLAKRLEVGLGDRLSFDVQGIQVHCTVASLREVNWRRLSPNFFVVFPEGAIEAAPAVHALVTRVEPGEQSATLQREVVRQFPNVSAVDLTLVLQTVDGILSKIAHVFRFMAMFTIGTGLIVLTGSVASGRQQRIRESVLLRTLGATKSQIVRILAAEYVMLGLLAALNGIVLANLAAWGISRWVFDVPFVFRPAPAAVALALVMMLTLFSGLLGNRRVLGRPPLEVLRVEN